MIGLEYYTPTPLQLKQMGELARCTRNKKIIYKEIETGYLISHPRCGGSGVVDKKTLGQIKKSHICPFCFSNIQSCSKNSREKNYQFISLDIGNETYGYYVDYEYTDELKTTITQVYYACGNECYHRMVGFNLFANALSYQPWNNEWKQTKRNKAHYYYGYPSEYSSYEKCMYDLDYCTMHYFNSKKSKREYLESVGRCIFKSNQKKIAIDNLLNYKQITFMVNFNLNSIDDVYKYNSYINLQYKNYNIDELLIKLNRQGANNIYYLDYLSRNKITISEYEKYVSNLIKLNFKIDKPKDFKFRDSQVENMAIEKENKEKNIKIQRRYSELPKYTKGSISISPFQTAQQIIKCGKALHNCLGTYVGAYSEGKTDIYLMEDNGKEIGAIEVKGNKLQQARLNNNEKCNDDLIPYVHDFCLQNNFTIENRF